jgi:hypothetical protein
MKTLSEQLAVALANVHRLERAIASSICAEVGHRWKSLG